ncbi:M23 family metallopeptidase, partial [Microtetraspora sp. NBRC 13810]|uniref:M23 family metallopeptidase n=1 Tax=Microtetraspora sp. NBRC 13810 TaxID=3030990 RepID=UPI002554C665
MNRTFAKTANLRRMVTVSALALAGLTVAAPLPVNAAAAPPAFQLPFPCGDKWRLDTWAHAPALDMVKEPDQAGTDGARLVAPAAGTVNQSFFHSNAGNMIQIDHGGGWFTTYIHLKSRSVNVGQRVEQGQQIGQVGATGPTSNGHPHLHYEQGFDANGDGRATWGAAGTERVRATFNGVEYGQSNSQTWRNVTSANGCVTTPVDGRLYREPDGTIAVIVGGAPVRFSSMAELTASGYGSAPISGVPAGWLGRLPQVPRDGSFLRNAGNGGIFVVVGGAKYGL